MNIYEQLKKDHDEVQAVLGQLAAAETAEARRTLISRIRDLLVPHSRAEEAILYNALRENDREKDVVAHSYQEHLKAETLLRGLQVTEAVSLNWRSGVDRLRADLAHHISEEEGKVFSAAKRVLTDDEAQAMGKAFVQLKPKLGAGFMMSNLELIVNLLPARFRKSFVDYLEQRESGDSKTRKAS